MTAEVEGEIVHDGRELSLLAAAKKQTTGLTGGWHDQTTPQHFKGLIGFSWAYSSRVACFSLLRLTCGR